MLPSQTSSSSISRVEEVVRFVLQRFRIPIIGGLVAAFFLYCTWPGLFIYLDGDDLMNLNYAWGPDLSKLTVANLVPFTTFYRPAGAAYYRICFFLFGFEPAPFRMVTYGLLLANVLLVFLLGRRLSGRAEIGVIAALLFSFHKRLRQVYMSNGTVYDVLCTTLTLLTLWYYVRLRQAGRTPRWHDWAILLALFTGALNAKEMAATLPALLFLYEWFYHGPTDRSWRGLLRWLWMQGKPAAVMLVLAGLAVWGKQQPGSLFYGHESYTSEFSVRRFFQNARHLYADLLYLEESSMNTAKVILLWAALFTGAALSRRRDLWVCVWFIVLTPLPIMFILFRGFFVMYLPAAGWAIYVAVVLVAGRDWLWRVIWKRPPLSASPWEPERILLFCLVAYAVHQGVHDKMVNLAVEEESQDIIRQSKADILRLNEPLSPGARVLLLNTRGPDDSWWPLMLMRVLYRDRNLLMDRPTMMKTAPNEADYDCVIDFDGENLEVVRRRAPLSRGATALPRVYPKR